jgi:hypothetical protein
MRNFVEGREDTARQKAPWFLLFPALATFGAATITRFYSESLNHRIRRLPVSAVRASCRLFIYACGACFL